MISPDSYAEEIKNLTIEQLTTLQDKLIKDINTIESKIKDNTPYTFIGSRETELEINKEYLSKINELISTKQRNNTRL